MRIVIKSTDLEYRGYKWTHFDRTDPHVSGLPDNTRLNRNEGEQVLYFINKYLRLVRSNSYEDARKVEWAIQSHVPSDISSQIGIVRWLNLNWHVL